MSESEQPTVNGVLLNELPEELQNSFRDIVSYEKDVIQALYGEFQRKKIALEEVAKIFTEQIETLKTEIEEKIQVRDNKAQNLATAIEEFKASKKEVCNCDGNCDPCKCKGE